MNPCHCGRPGEACLWCLKDHPSGVTKHVFRCWDHRTEHEWAHLLPEMEGKMKSVISDAKLTDLPVPEFWEKLK